MTIIGLYDLLVAAGLPVVSATDDGAVSFSRGLTPDEEIVYHDIIQPEMAAVRARKKNAKANAAAVTTLWNVSGADVVKHVHDNGGSVPELRARVEELAAALKAVIDDRWPDQNGQSAK